MKKYLVYLLMIALCFSLCSCRKNKNKAIDTDTQQDYNITDWFNNNEMEQGTDDGSFDALDPEGVALPDYIW